MTPGAVRGVLLDLDGTLVDSAASIVASLHHAFAVHGLDPPAPQRIREALGPPLQDWMASFAVPPEHLPAVVGTYRAHYEEHALAATSVYDGVAPMLAELRADGAVLVVATSKSESAAETLLAGLGLAMAVDAVAGASADGSRRSKADVVARALGLLSDAAAGRPGGGRPGGGGPSSDGPGGGSVVHVGDRRHDVEGAHAHRLPCLGVTWGYAAAGELEAAGADALATAPGEVAALVRRLAAAGVVPGAGVGSALRAGSGSPRPAP